MKCSNCGNEMSDAAKFCPYCGTAVAVSAESTDTSAGNGSVYENEFRSGNTDIPETSREIIHSSEVNDQRSEPLSYGAPEQKRGMGIAGMVLGLATLTFCWFIYIAVITGVLGIILSAVSQKYGRNGFAKAGLITSIIGLALAVILLIVLGMAAVYGIRYYYY